MNALQCIASGEENSKIALFLWVFVILSDEDRATAIANMHKKFGKDRACGSKDILSDGQTDRQTHNTHKHTDRRDRRY